MKKAFIITLILITMLSAVVYAADMYGYTGRQGTYYEYPRYYGGYPAPDRYYKTALYPERYYHQPVAYEYTSRPYDYTSYLYRYGTREPRVLERPSYIGLMDRVASGALEGQLCGVLQNKFYDCASGLTCDIRENQIGLCVRPSTV